MKNNILLYKSSLIFIKNSERVKTWIKHTINKNYTNKDRMISLFEYICQLDTETRIESLLYFITKNDSIEDFKVLNIEPLTKTWSGSETPPLEKDIEIYKKLLEKIKGIKFIKHKKYLEEKIEYLKEKIRKIEKKEYLDKYN